MKKKNKNFFLRMLKRFMKTFVRLETIEFSDNGINKEYVTMYIGSKRIASRIYKVDEKDEQAEWLGII